MDAPVPATRAAALHSEFASRAALVEKVIDSLLKNDKLLCDNPVKQTQLLEYIAFKLFAKHRQITQQGTEPKANAKG